LRKSPNKSPPHAHNSRWLSSCSTCSHCTESVLPGKRVASRQPAGCTCRRNQQDSTGTWRRRTKGSKVRHTDTHTTHTRHTHACTPTHTRAYTQKHTHTPGTAYGTCRTRVRKQGGSSSTAPPPANADQPETARHLIEHCLVLKSRVINVSSSCNRSFSAKSRKARQANLCTPTLPPTPTLTPTRTELPAATRAAGEDCRHVRAVHLVANHDRVYRTTCSKRRPLITRQAHASCRKQLRPVAPYPTLAIGIITTAKGLQKFRKSQFDALRRGKKSVAFLPQQTAWEN
jgi:hypothetical protein